MKLAPARNKAQKTLRDNGFVGFILHTCGFIQILVAVLVDSRAMIVVGAFMVVSGVLIALPTLVAHAIQLERESRGSA